MILQYKLTNLHFKFPFRITHGERKTTPVVFVAITADGKTGYGEGSMPPYLGEDHSTAGQFLNKVNPEHFDIDRPASWKNTLDNIAPDTYAVKAAIDIALHDLHCKLRNISLSSLYNVTGQPPLTSYTIGMSNPAEMKSKLNEASEFKVIKLKLGGRDYDEEMVRMIRDYGKKYSVDFNQANDNREHA